MAQSVIACFELAVCIMLCFNWQLNYVSVAYMYWPVIEIAIIIVMIKKGYIKKRSKASYIIAVICIAAMMVYCVIVKGYTFFFSYFNTFIGMWFWLAFVVKNKDYPIKPMTLALFVTKFIADAISIPVYNGKGNAVTNTICILLPVVDALFIILYYKRNAIKTK